MPNEVSLIKTKKIMSKEDLRGSMTIDGYTFKLDRENDMYECRGDICHDEEHDEIPEEGLWQAALKLETQLIEIGFKADASHSEKGWVEVNI